MNKPYDPAVAVLIETCTRGLAMSEYLYRDEWPDIGKAGRELLHKRVMAVLEATGIPLDVLAQAAGVAGAEQVPMAPEAVAKPPSIEVRRWGWWRR